MCGLQNRNYAQVFATLASRIELTAPLASLKIALARLGDKQRFPSDDEFRRELTTRDLYSLRTCHYLLDRLENHETKEPADTSRYTVEHIMPQNAKLSAKWRDMLGSDWRNIQAE